MHDLFIQLQYSSKTLNGWYNLFILIGLIWGN